MTLSAKKKEKIIGIIYRAVKDKLDNYAPESEHKPFHHSILGKDRMALFSFVHSFNTTFGTSIYEQVSRELALDVFSEVDTQRKMPEEIGVEAQDMITSILNQLSDKTKPRITRQEINTMLRQRASSGESAHLKSLQVDLYLRDHADRVYLIDLKTAKPNKGDWQKYKQTLLEWASIHYRAWPDIEVQSLIAIPYNPYHPKPYSRWTVQGFMDVKDEVKIAEEFWNFVGGGDVYDDLLDCFKAAGKLLEPEIDSKFAKFK